MTTKLDVVVSHRVRLVDVTLFVALMIGNPSRMTAMLNCSAVCTGAITVVGLLLGVDEGEEVSDAKGAVDGCTERDGFGDSVGDTVGEGDSVGDIVVVMVGVPVLVGPGLSVGNKLGEGLLEGFADGGASCAVTTWPITTTSSTYKPSRIRGFDMQLAGRFGVPALRAASESPDTMVVL